MLKNTGDSSITDDRGSETDRDRRNDQPVDDDVEVIDIDAEAESNKGGVATKAVRGSGTPNSCSENGHTGGGERVSLEGGGGRKRICSRTGEGDGGRGDKGRKRPKGTGEEGDEEEEEGRVNGEGVACEKESCEAGCCDDGSEVSAVVQFLYLAVAPQ